MSKQIDIKDVINESLTGDTQKNVLDFVAFLQANDLPPAWDGDWWCVDYRGKNLVLVGIDKSGIQFGALFSSCNFGNIHLVSDEIKETAWAHVQICGHFESGGTKCGCNEQPGLVSIFGKEFNACKSPLTFINPDAKTLENMKQLILLLKSCTDDK